MKKYQTPKLLNQKKALMATAFLILAISYVVVNDSLYSVMAQSETDSPTASIDVFTNKGGIGQNINSSAYTPHELVYLYATVTYGDASLANQDVVFCVESENGSLIALRVARTNTTGIASSEFRLPQLSRDSLTAGESWTVKGSVNVSQVTVIDSSAFKVGYSCAIKNADIKVASQIQRLENLKINITVSDLTDAADWSKLDITLIDQAQIPIGSYSAKHTANDNGSVNATILIPDWAFLGQAKAYICLLSEGGTAMAPETIVNFEIIA